MALLDDFGLLGIQAVLVSCLAWVITGAAYRLIFSPIAKFPGPKLAALTSWYEFYYDYFQRGRFTWKIKELHTQYGQSPLGRAILLFIPITSECKALTRRANLGPVIRINPRELSIDDPDFLLDKIFDSRFPMTYIGFDGDLWRLSSLEPWYPDRRI